MKIEVASVATGGLIAYININIGYLEVNYSLSVFIIVVNVSYKGNVCKSGIYTKSGGVALSAHSAGGLPEPPLGRESNESGVALRDRGSLPLEFCNK